MNLSNFIESLLLLCTDWKSFNFSSVYLLEVDQAQTTMLFCQRGFFYMEIWPKGIFISIWYLSVQSKVHNKNLRKKRETSEVFSESCQTSKMKILNNFHLLPIVFIT